MENPKFEIGDLVLVKEKERTKYEYNKEWTVEVEGFAIILSYVLITHQSSRQFYSYKCFFQQSGKEYHLDELELEGSK